MDISGLKPAERIVEILNPKDKTPLGINVMLVSLDDERVKKIRRRIQDDRIRLESRGKSFKSEDVEENTISLLFACVTGWEWGKDPSGEQNLWKGLKPDFNLKTFKEIITDLPWFGKQLEEAISDEESFFQT